MPGPFTKTTWNEGAAPGISAAQLNRMETGIERGVNNVFTTAERDALAGADLWEGRIIWNTTTKQVEVRQSTSWRRVPMVLYSSTTEVQVASTGTLEPLWLIMVPSDVLREGRMLRTTSWGVVWNPTSISNDALTARWELWLGNIARIMTGDDPVDERTSTPAHDAQRPAMWRSTVEIVQAAGNVQEVAARLEVVDFGRDNYEQWGLFQNAADMPRNVRVGRVTSDLAAGLPFTASLRVMISAAGGRFISCRAVVAELV